MQRIGSMNEQAVDYYVVVVLVVVALAYTKIKRNKKRIVVKLFLCWPNHWLNIYIYFNPLCEMSENHKTHHTLLAPNYLSTTTEKFRILIKFFLGFFVSLFFRSLVQLLEMQPNEREKKKKDGIKIHLDTDSNSINRLSLATVRFYSNVKTTVLFFSIFVLLLLRLFLSI